MPLLAWYLLGGYKLYEPTHGHSWWPGLDIWSREASQIIYLMNLNEEMKRVVTLTGRSFGYRSGGHVLPCVRWIDTACQWTQRNRQMEKMPERNKSRRSCSSKRLSFRIFQELKYCTQLYFLSLDSLRTGYLFFFKICLLFVFDWVYIIYKQKGFENSISFHAWEQPLYLIQLYRWPRIAQCLTE